MSRRLVYVLREVVESGMRRVARLGGRVSSARRRAAISAWLMPTSLAPMCVGRRWVLARMGMVGASGQVVSVSMVSFGGSFGWRMTMAQVVIAGDEVVSGVWPPSMERM